MGGASATGGPLGFLGLLGGTRSDAQKPGAPMESYAPGLTKLPTDLAPSPGPKPLDVMGLAQPGQSTNAGGFAPGPEGVSAQHAASVAALRQPTQYNDTLGSLESLDQYMNMKRQMEERMAARRAAGNAFDAGLRADDMAVLGLNDAPEPGYGTGGGGGTQDQMHEDERDRYGGY